MRPPRPARLRSYPHGREHDDNTLASWRDGAAKSAIRDFVARVTTAGGVEPRAAADRIATFDNDGTLWLEKPMYSQLQHGLRAIARLAAEHPELRERQPFKAVCEKDMAWFGKVDRLRRGDPSVSSRSRRA